MRKVSPSQVYRLFYPSVPAIVAAALGGKTYAMPVVSIISLSNDPTLIGISSSPSHATFPAVLEAKCFSVSWLDRRYRRAIEQMGTSSGREVADKLGASGLHHRVASRPRVPVIAEASAYLTCSVELVQRYGDHELLVGRVEEARADADFEEYWTFENYRPILYTGLGKRSLSFSPGSDDLE